jgi:hypothetical protein
VPARPAWVSHSDNSAKKASFTPRLYSHNARFWHLASIRDSAAISLAFGAQRTCTVVRFRRPRLWMTHSGDGQRWPAGTHRTNMRNPGSSPTTVMCPLQGEVSSNRNTLPGRSRLVSPSVVVMEKVPCRTMPN